LTAVLKDGIARAAGEGARLVCLPEITLLRYPAKIPAGANPGEEAEDLQSGPTFSLAAEAATANGVFGHASLYDKAASPDGEADGLRYNCAILVSPSGELVGRTRKLHIPISAGYYEHTNGSRRWPAATRSAAPRSSSIRRPSGRSRRSPPSRPSRCGST
jgi:N-carbamoylputrescine amidase